MWWKVICELCTLMVVAKLFIVWYLHGFYISYNTTVVRLINRRDIQSTNQPTNQPRHNTAHQVISQYLIPSFILIRFDICIYDKIKLLNSGACNNILSEKSINEKNLLLFLTKVFCFDDAKTSKFALWNFVAYYIEILKPQRFENTAPWTPQELYPWTPLGALRLYIYALRRAPDPPGREGFATSRSQCRLHPELKALHLTLNQMSTRPPLSMCCARYYLLP